MKPRHVVWDRDPILVHPIIYSEVRALIEEGQVETLLDLIRTRSEQGDVKFKLIYAICLARGVMGSKDKSKAKRLLESTDASVCADAMSLQGEAYQYGYIIQDREQAERIFHALCEVCSFKGNYMLARFYYSDRVKGGGCHDSRILKCYEKASVAGHLISAFFHASLASSTAFQKRLKFVKWGVSQAVFRPKLSRVDRLWRYGDLRFISPRLFQRYDSMYARSQQVKR